jgi:hypothetical protein
MGQENDGLSFQACGSTCSRLCRAADRHPARRGEGLGQMLLSRSSCQTEEDAMEPVDERKYRPGPRSGVRQ